MHALWVREHKSHWLLLGTLVPLVDSVRLRAEDPKTALNLRPHTEVSEWNVRNITGLVLGILVIGFLFLSFVFSDQFRQRKSKLKILQVVILSKQAEDSKPPVTPPMPLSAVIKINSETPVHHVIPVEATVGESSSVKCSFELEQAALESTAFSIIIREGNIPIHFGTVKISRMIEKSTPVPGIKRARQLDLLLDNQEEQRLKGKSVLLIFEINK